MRMALELAGALICFTVGVLVGARIMQRMFAKYLDELRKELKR